MKSTPQRIDLHHHVVPPDFTADLARRNIEWTGGVPVPKWTAAGAMEVMDRYGIAAAVMSVQPQVYWGDQDMARHWARYGNEFLARVVHNNPDHFGGFASVPLPDTDAACREVEYALDTLRLDGVLLISSAGRQYLGDPQFDELMHELNRRSAVVFIHPNTLPPGSDVPSLNLPYALGEFVFDTTRSVLSLLYNGTLERYPSIRFVLAHAGGTVPYLGWRLTIGEISPRLRERVPKGVMHYLRRLYYETALSSSDPSLAALQQFVPLDQIVFGSDIPMAPPNVVQDALTMFDSTPVLDDAARQAIGRNGLALFPRFADVSASLLRSSRLQGDIAGDGAGGEDVCATVRYAGGKMCHLARR
jgi:predicted TIM-barrel fold metal-dependent hydrolase